MREVLIVRYRIVLEKQGAAAWIASLRTSLSEPVMANAAALSLSGQPLRLVRTSQSAKSRQGGAFTAAPGLGSRQGLDWIAIPPPIARKHAPFLSLVSFS
jgi:hypothetical protein